MKQTLIALFTLLSFNAFSQIQTSWQVMTPSVLGDSNIIYTMSAPTKNNCVGGYYRMANLGQFYPNANHH